MAHRAICSPRGPLVLAGDTQPKGRRKSSRAAGQPARPEASQLDCKVRVGSQGAEARRAELACARLACAQPAAANWPPSSRELNTRQRARAAARQAKLASGGGQIH